MRSQITFHDKSRTQQEFKDKQNINAIVKRHTETGVWTSVMKNDPLFDDVSNVMTYKEALNVQIEAQRNFNKLPAKTRERFKNDPARLLDFLNVKDNYDEAVELGLVKPKEKTPPPPVVPPTTPPTTPPVVPPTDPPA